MEKTNDQLYTDDHRAFFLYVHIETTVVVEMVKFLSPVYTIQPVVKPV